MQSATALQAPAAPVPLPPPRPVERRPALSPPTAPPPGASLPSSPTDPQQVTAAPPQASAEEVAACDALLSAGTVRAERLPPMGGDTGCGMALPLKLSAVVLAGTSEVALEPPVTIRCAMAGAVADWVRLDLAPLLTTQGGLSKLSGLGGYACRSRNHVVGAKMSEHALGNAVDVGALVLKNGRPAKLSDVAADAPLFAAVKLTACARFSTVLGPGSDAFHKDHLHVDIEARRGGRRLCEWQLP